MTRISIKGHEFNQLIIRDSYDRRAIQYKNDIISSLKKIGLSEDDVEVEIPKSARIDCPASASWWIHGQFLHFSTKVAKKYAENLYVIAKVIDLEVKALLNDEKTINEFINSFTEENNIVKKRKEARQILGVDENCMDINIINQKYKILAKEHHPDLGGDLETFKKINNAHKMLKRELT